MFVFGKKYFYTFSEDPFNQFNDSKGGKSNSGDFYIKRFIFQIQKIYISNKLLFWTLYSS